MAAWCLTKQAKEALLKALREQGDTKVLTDMSSSDRIAWLEKSIGRDNAERVNTIFERDVLLPNRKKGMVKFINTVVKDVPARRDLIARVNRVNDLIEKNNVQTFLQGVSEQAVGVAVTQEQMAEITKMAKETKSLKEEAVKEGATQEDKLKYGLQREYLRKYVGELKEKARGIKFREEPARYVARLPIETMGLMKSILASWDNSLYGRQGAKILLNPRTTGIWARAFAKSWPDIGRQLIAKGKIWKSGDDAVMDMIRAEIYGRENALNGKYEADPLGYNLGVAREDTIPSSLPEKIPFFGRLFKASEVAFNGGALRMRADLADLFIRLAEQNGQDVYNKKTAQGLSSMVGALTGRADLGKYEAVADDFNKTFFSIRFLKSNFDFLTAHLLDKKATPYVKKEAAKNLLGVAVTTAVVLAAARAMLGEDAVETDPRSPNAGKIKFDGVWYDFMGGLGGMLNIASQLVPTTRNGKIGFWKKHRDGYYEELGQKYGAPTAEDVFTDYFAGKVAPAAGILRDIWRGRMISGEKPTPENLVKGAFTPLPMQAFKKYMSRTDSSNTLIPMILEGLGYSGSLEYYNENWDTRDTKEMNDFKEQVGEEKFKVANEAYNRELARAKKTLLQEEEYKSSSDEEKKEAVAGLKSKTKDSILKKYGYVGKTSEWTDSTSKEMQAFKEKVGEEKLKKANESFNTLYENWVKKTRSKEQFKKLSTEKQDNLLRLGKEDIKERVLKQYGFEYKAPKTSKQEENNIKSLRP